MQWATTVLFGALTACSLWRLVTARHLFAGTGHLFHLGMNLVMVAMVWPWWARLPAPPQVAFFAAGAAFFAGAVGWFALDGLSTTDRRRAGRRRSARCQAVNAVMMLAMVWMLAVMTRHADGVGGTAGAAHSAHAAAPVPPDVTTVAGGSVLLAALAAGGVLFLVDLVRYRRRHDALGRTGADLLAGALMSLGMAAACGLVLVG